jgi:oligoribonuclease
MSRIDNFPTRLLWIDLEMTGLVPSQDVILEVGSIVTDFEFSVLDSYESRVSHPVELVKSQMDANPWWQDYPGNRKQFIRGLADAESIDKVEQYLCGVVAKYFGSERAVLAGNSIYNDRLFIKQWMPKLESLLHYRMLDVSSLKIIMQGKFGQEYKKPPVHRALSDIRASIAELQSYLEFFGKE